MGINENAFNPDDITGISEDKVADYIKRKAITNCHPRKNRAHCPSY